MNMFFRQVLAAVIATLLKPASSNGAAACGGRGLQPWFSTCLPLGNANLRLELVRFVLVRLALVAFTAVTVGPAHATPAQAEQPPRVLINGYEQYTEATCILLQQELQRVADNAALQQRTSRTLTRHCQQPQQYAAARAQFSDNATTSALELSPEALKGRVRAVDAALNDAASAPTSQKPVLQQAFSDALWQALEYLKAAYYAFMPLFNGLFVLLLCMLLIKLFASKLLFGSAVWIGRQAEKQLAKRLKRLLSDEFVHYHNLVLPTAQGDLTEIDHLVLSPYGLFVIEVKNHQGWVFGHRDQPQWTVQRFRHKHKLANPLRQNYKHIKALEHLLQLPHSKVPAALLHSLVAFSSRAIFKTDLPANVMHIQQVDGYIRSHINAIEPALSSEQLGHIQRLLNNFAEQAPTLRKLHLQQLKAGT